MYTSFNEVKVISFEYLDHATNIWFEIKDVDVAEDGRSFEFVNQLGKKNTKLEMVSDYSRCNRSLWDVYEEGTKVARIVGDTKQIDKLFIQSIGRRVPRYDNM
mgnify:CR=1 FL=1